MRKEAILNAKRGNIDTLDKYGKGSNIDVTFIAIECYKFRMHYAKTAGCLDIS
jgi:hypothetical protein